MKIRQHDKQQGVCMKDETVECNSLVYKLQEKVN